MTRCLLQQDWEVLPRSKTVENQGRHRWEAMDSHASRGKPVLEPWRNLYELKNQREDPLETRFENMCWNMYQQGINKESSNPVVTHEA